jgi:hypothetical protein
MAEAVLRVELGFSLPRGKFILFNIHTDNGKVAEETCRLIRPLIEYAVNEVFGRNRDDQQIRIRPGCLHGVDLHCFTHERFLEVLGDYESGGIKERLQNKFTEAGIKVEGLKVAIENMEEVNKIKAAINKRYMRVVEDILVLMLFTSDVLFLANNLLL